MGAEQHIEVAAPLSRPQVKGCRGPFGEFGAHGTVEVGGNARDVFDFVARVEDQPQWNQGVKVSEVLDCEGSTKRIKQVLSWNFLALHGDFHIRLRSHEDVDALKISTELEEGGAMMRRFTSHVSVDSTGPGRCRLEMSMFMQPRIFVPFGIRSMVGGQVRRQLHGVLARLKESVEEQHAAGDGGKGLAA